MTRGPTVLSLAQKASDTFNRNIDTMIAAFLIRNPDVNPADIELVFQPSIDGKMHFWINQRPNGVKLPGRREADVVEGKPVTQGLGNTLDFVSGWNDCIEEVKRLNARQDNELRAPVPGAPEDAVIVSEPS